MSSSSRVCGLCECAAKLRCSGCQQMFYCTKEHQKMHWKQHKAQCCPYQICESPSLGRYLVSTRDLRAGEVILSERPLLVAPMADSVPVCLGCYKAINCTFRCPDCGWPLCSSACPGLASAHAPECAITKQRGKPIKLDFPHLWKKYPVYESVGVMRLMHLKLTDPVKYAKVIDMEAHLQHQEPEWQFKDSTVLKLLRTFLCVSADTWSDDEIVRLARVLRINAHEVPTSPVMLQAVYANISLLQHSCISNASKHFADNFGLVVRAGVNIRKGESICISYTDPMWGTAARQSHLSLTKLFRCTCRRCADPTELGTHFSSVRCPDCEKAFAAPDADACKCVGCGARLDAYVTATVEAVGKELVALEKNNEAVCVAFLAKHAAILHQNHFYLLDVKLALCQIMDASSAEALVRKRAVCQQLLEVINVITPGISRLRAIVLHELLSSTFHLAQIDFFQKKIDPEQMADILSTARSGLLECATIFGFEMSHLPEGRLLAVVRQELQQIDQFRAEILGLEPQQPH